MKVIKNLSIFLVSLFLLISLIFCLSACNKTRSATSEDLVKRIEKGNTLDVELVFECPDPLVAVDSDKEGNFYLASYNGDVFRVSKDGANDKVYSGINCCGFSLTSLTVLPGGDLIVNDCVDDKDVLFRIYKNGGRIKVVEIDGNLLSLTSDNSGRIFAGVWVSEGNLTVNFNPNHLSAADYIAGKILKIDENGKTAEIYEDGLPMNLRIDASEKLTAAIWGKKGGFEAEAKSYSVADLRHMFWVTLTEDAKIISVEGEKKINTGDLESISSFDFLGNGSLVVQGIPAIGGAGLYLLKEGTDPIELTFNQDKIDHSITGLKVSNGSLYFTNVDGKFYRVK